MEGRVVCHLSSGYYVAMLDFSVILNINGVEKHNIDILKR